MSGQSWLQHLTPNESLINSMENQKIPGNGTSGVIIEGEIEKVDQKRKRGRPLGSKKKKKLRWFLMPNLKPLELKLSLVGLLGFDEIVSCGGGQNPKGSKHKIKKMITDADAGGNEVVKQGVEFQLDNVHVGPKQSGRNMIQESSKNVHKGEESTKTQKEIAVGQKLLLSFFCTFI